MDKAYQATERGTCTKIPSKYEKNPGKLKGRDNIPLLISVNIHLATCQLKSFK